MLIEAALAYESSYDDDKGSPTSRNTPQRLVTYPPPPKRHQISIQYTSKYTPVLLGLLWSHQIFPKPLIPLIPTLSFLSFFVGCSGVAGPSPFAASLASFSFALSFFSFSFFPIFWTPPNTLHQNLCTIRQQ